jgi:hypothetical protein
MLTEDQTNIEGIVLQREFGCLVTHKSLGGVSGPKDPFRVNMEKRLRTKGLRYA